MVEYIARDAARPDAFCIGVSCQDCPFLKSPLYGGCRIDDFIVSIPTADVRPVVRGHWITEEEAEAKGDYSLRDACSVCGRCDWDCTESASFNYCPNCGADMREES